MYLTVQPINMPMPVTATQIKMHSILTQLTIQEDFTVVSHYKTLKSYTANPLYSQRLHFREELVNTKFMHTELSNLQE